MKEIKKLINKYITDMSKTIGNVNKEWKGEEEDAKELGIKVIYPRVYSEQYFAYIKLLRFFRELRELDSQSNEVKKK